MVSMKTPISTFGARLRLQCVVPAGGLSPDHTHWVRSPKRFFLPKPVLRKVFRGKFVEALQQAFHHGHLHFQGDLKPLAQPKTFAAWLRPLYRKNWGVYLKPPFGGPEHVLRYLGRYTHRVAISNHRLVSFADGQVTFRWRDSAHHNEQKLMSLPLDEFLRRLLLHCSPNASCAFANSAFWPTGGAPPSCRFAFSCWARHNSDRRNKTLPPPKMPTIFIAALNGVDR
jgi:hypothetical protein